MDRWRLDDVHPRELTHIKKNRIRYFLIQKQRNKYSIIITDGRENTLALENANTTPRAYEIAHLIAKLMRRQHATSLGPCEPPSVLNVSARRVSGYCWKAWALTCPPCFVLLTRASLKG
ncbi:hypothetical protein EVAR_64261_1 [Eumeta japonica]|uniref:Uncharacterized protein n=1 Tax=Eumeta variegata TaxID=151549 RepID=A0A4C1YYA1_EUMVA|nr:hypothetical protein EVAR_64261_1 [Eumeta japonica]